MKKKTAQKWMLAGKQIGETSVEKYLGVELCKGLNFKLFKDRKVKEARQRMMRVWAMGMRGGQMPVKQCVNVWKTLVRPVLAYGAAVIGDVKWQEAEQIQRRMGKMILRCSEKMTNEVVLGELGWWSMKGRRDLVRLLFWGKVVACLTLVLSIICTRSVEHSIRQANRANGARRCMLCCKASD